MVDVGPGEEKILRMICSVDEDQSNLGLKPFCQRDDVDNPPPGDEEQRRPCLGRPSVNGLPVEILAAVFLRVLERRTIPRRDRDGNSGSPPDTSSLYASMLVCRRWRDVAIGSPELWRVLPPSIPREAATIFLKRSCSVPISAYTDTRALSAPEKPLHLEGLHLSRLEELYVLPTPPFWSFSVATPLSSNLIFLELQRPTDRPCTEMKLVDYPIFGGCSPALQALSINPLIIVPSDYFPALAHLRLAGPRWFPIPISQLLRLLSNTPALETLYLAQTAIHDDIGTNLATEPVPLRRLRTLSLEPRVSLRAAAAFLAHLVLPRTLIFQLHRIQVHCRARPADDVYVPPLDPPTTLELVENARDRRLHVRARGTAHGFWLHFIPGSHDFSLRDEFLKPVLARLAPSALHGVTTLRVAATAYSGFLDCVLPWALELCSELTILVVAAPQNGACGVVAAVADALSPVSPLEAPGAVPWRTLDTLGLQLELGDMDADLFPIADLLARRAQRGCRLRCLVISTPRTSIDGQAGRSLKLKNLNAVEAQVDRIEVTERVLWDIVDDGLWRVENRWWPLYPRTKMDMRDGWGLGGVAG